MTFKELKVGQKFRKLNYPRTEWTKVELVRFKKGHVRYNATADDGRTMNFGHGAKVLLPPYTLEEKKTSLYHKFSEKLKQAGWKSETEYRRAVVTGHVTIPAPTTSETHPIE